MLKDFNFNLPQELIAQYPLDRGKARLLHRSLNGHLTNMDFSQICDLLQSGDVLVFNNTKVIPSCLYGYINNIKLKINLINRVIDCNSIKWEFLSKPRKKVKVGSIITFTNQLVGVVIEKSNDNGLDVIEFFIDKNRDKEQYISYSQENFRLKSISELEFFNLLNEIGEMPLPPYMKRTPVKDDERNYQTVFSEITGSVAAPTAGLHFSQELLDKIKSKGVKIVYVTLHIGGGTFLPIRVDNIAHHKMHSEFYSIDGATCDIINRAKLDRHRVIAVGTTVIRVLESAAEFCDNDILYPHSRYTNIFINGNFNFKVVDCLITNFHLPKSTLFILICAFLGSIDNGQNLYKYAIDNQYRFFSYGDGCFLIR